MQQLSFFARAIMFGNNPNNIALAYTHCGYFDKQFKAERFTAYTNAALADVASGVPPEERFEKANKILLDKVKYHLSEKSTLQVTQMVRGADGGWLHVGSQVQRPPPKISERYISIISYGANYSILTLT